jgi:hypothetical protein
VNYGPLFLAAVFGTLAVVGLIRHKAPRITAILAALAVLCILAGVPSMLAMLGHPIGRGPILLGIIVATIAFAAFFYFDVIRGEHKTPLLGRKAIGGGQGGQPGGGGGKANHHVRPLVASVGLAVFGLLIAMNWHAVISGTGGGVSQTFSIIGHSGS